MRAGKEASQGRAAFRHLPGEWGSQRWGKSRLVTGVLCSMWGRETAEHQLLHTWGRDSKNIYCIIVFQVLTERRWKRLDQRPQKTVSEEGSKLTSRSSGLSGSDEYQARKERAALPQECQCQEWVAADWFCCRRTGKGATTPKPLKRLAQKMSLNSGMGMMF